MRVLVKDKLIQQATWHSLFLFNDMLLMIDDTKLPPVTLKSIFNFQAPPSNNMASYSSFSSTNNFDDCNFTAIYFSFASDDVLSFESSSSAGFSIRKPVLDITAPFFMGTKSDSKT